MKSSESCWFILVKYTASGTIKIGTGSSVLAAFNPQKNRWSIEFKTRHTAAVWQRVILGVFIILREAVVVSAYITFFLSLAKHYMKNQWECLKKWSHTTWLVVTFIGTADLTQWEWSSLQVSILTVFTSCHSRFCVVVRLSGGWVWGRGCDPDEAAENSNRPWWPWCRSRLVSGQGCGQTDGHW